ncbi:hypothetical protein HZS61_003208 [Fusarium oxysporum f. sp. conglutinans]|uniref:ATP-dependent DNA helicase PIF1 n=1 Tax=Fusarium oxysporum f. sp. conglutinans TaxID=100902 RepID=A0A8H6GGB5_FUSOX|nr:hypothetical protein HZS61_003208 [Fusarium oxysporum f. sp. conglutinans]
MRVWCRQGTTGLGYSYLAARFHKGGKDSQDEPSKAVARAKQAAIQRDHRSRRRVGETVSLTPTISQLGVFGDFEGPGEDASQDRLQPSELLGGDEIRKEGDDRGQFSESDIDAEDYFNLLLSPARPRRYLKQLGVESDPDLGDEHENSDNDCVDGSPLRHRLRQPSARPRRGRRGPAPGTGGRPRKSPRQARSSMPPRRIRSPVIIPPEELAVFHAQDPVWNGDLDACALTDRDKATLREFWTTLDNDQMEYCTRCQECWFQMKIDSDGICERCYRKDRKRRPDEPYFFSADNQLDFGPVPARLPQLTPTEESLLARVHVHVNIMLVRGQQYKYRGHVVHFLREVGLVYNQLPLLPQELNTVLLRPANTSSHANLSRQFTRQFRVRRQPVVIWLDYLRRHHPGYRCVVIDEERLNQLPQDGNVLDAIPQSQVETADVGPDSPEEDQEAEPDLEDEAAVPDLLAKDTKGVLNSTPSLQAFFPIGSVPTRFMIAFFRDRDPAGRCEPEGMESTSPSTNDVDVLSSSTLAVDSLATPAPSLQEETPHEEVEHQYLWRCFPDYVWSQRVRDTPSWVWGFGYDVEDSSGGRRWVCRRCIQNKNPKPRSFAEKGIQNANAHLFKGHGIRAPPDKTKSAAEKKAEKLKAKDQRSIAEVMKLDTRLPREQDIANSLVKGFDRKHFQRLLLEWIIEENHAFSVCEQGRLRQIFEYLNPLVKITDANITRTTIRRKVLSAYEMHKDKVVAALKQSCGLIHVSFDGWKSGNRHSLYGIACFFRDENSQPRKLALGVPELRTRHFGHNIAAEILDVLDAYGIQDKIGYFTLDNAESNDKAMEVIGGELGFVGSRRRGRCFGHTLNLSAKALLFGHNVEAFEEQLSGEAALSEAEHTLWRRKGPVGKLHNLVVDVRRSDQLTYLLRSIQRSEFDLSSDPRIRARQPVDLIIDNDTRWLSQLYMIRRAIILRPFIEQLVLKHRQQWEQDNRSKRTGNLRKSAREPRICLEENQLTVNDWVVLEHLAKLLGFYEDAVKTLEGDGQQRKRKGGWVGSYGNVWEVIQGFEFLLEVLEDYKQLASEIPDAEHFRINVNLGWEKLNKYYSRLDETPIYYTALALHPAFRWGYFENEWKDNTKWVMKAKQMIREVWESNYRHLQMVRSPVDDEPVAKRQRKYYNPFQAYCERTRPVLGYGLVKEEATLSDDINEDTNELELWQSSWEDGDNDVRDPISYWHERKRRYPRLSRMALDFLTIQPMSAEFFVKQQDGRQQPLTREQLIQALEHSEDPEAQALINSITRHAVSIRGTRPFWNKRRQDLEAYAYNLGCPGAFITFSPADLHWRSLYQHMPQYDDWLAATEPERMALSRRLLRQNPHIAAFHFYRRYCLFRDIVLSKKFNITDYWDRYEWQGRGSPHNHGLYWMDSCPGTDMDDEAARDVFARTWGFHVTAINPEPSRAMPQGEGNPLSVDPLSIEMTFLRLSQIVNRCQRHKCNTTYCLRVRKRTGDLARDMEGAAADIEAANVANPERECRFDFPRALRELAAVIRKEGRSYYVFEAARNDSLMNHFNPAIILGWLANIDISPCTSLQAVITYAAKYCSKSEKKTEPYCKLADQVLPHTAHLQPLLSFSSRLMNKLIAERDYSAQEISHLLLNIPLQEGTRMVVVVDCRPLELHGRSYRVDEDVIETVGSYRKYLERNDQHEDVTYLEYLQSYNLKTWRRLAANAKKRVLSYFPRYKSIEASPQFNDFCRVKLMMAHPHRSPRELLVMDGQRFDSFAAVYKFCRQLHHTHADDHYGDPDAKELRAEDDEFEPEAHEEPVTEEDWHELARMLPDRPLEEEDIDILGRRDIDINYDWTSHIGRYTDDGILNGDYWKQRKAENLLDLDVDDQPLEARDSLNPEQRLVYDTVMDHFLTQNPSQLLLHVDGGGGQCWIATRVVSYCFI